MTDLDFMAMDGTLSEFLAVPVIIAAWILVVVFLDRWVRKGVGVPSDRHGSMLDPAIRQPTRESLRDFLAGRLWLRQTRKP